MYGSKALVLKKVLMSLFGEISSWAKWAHVVLATVKGFGL
jgi:hypothetical protein